MNYRTDFFSEDGYLADTNVDDVTYKGVGQTFHNTQRCELSSVQLFLMKSGLPTGNMTVKIYAMSGTYGSTGVPTGDALATSDNFDTSTLGAVVLGLEEFTFSGANRIILEANTKYVVLFESLAAWDATKYVVAGCSNAGGHNGNMVLYDGTTWTADANWDLCFYVYVESQDTVRTVVGRFNYATGPKKKYAISTFQKHKKDWEKYKEEATRRGEMIRKIVKEKKLNIRKPKWKI